MKKKILATMLLATTISTVNSYAAVNGLTHHSRANCGTNETISWDLTQKQLTWIRGWHSYKKYRGGDASKFHMMDSGWQNVRRNALVHWTEGTGGWSVEGVHYMKDRSGTTRLVASETIYDCNLYNGWWDYKIDDSAGGGK